MENQPKDPSGDLGRSGHGARCDRLYQVEHDGRVDRQTESDAPAARRRVATHTSGSADRPARGPSSAPAHRPRRPTSRNSSHRPCWQDVDVLEDLVGTGLAAEPPARDMFDFLEDAARRLDQASHDLAVRDLEQFRGRWLR